jgi:hypothetical protein
MEIRKAERKRAKLRMGIAAPSGAGKTYSALLLAFGLGGKVGLIDTECGSGDLYANLGDYDIISIDAQYTIAKYLQAIKAFESAGYSTIIIDSLSHAWAGDGGLLDKQGKIAGTGNGYAAWRTITPEQNSLVTAMLASPCHIIGTMRSKTDYVQEKDERTGKTVIRKVGLAPVQRDGLEYEFSVMLNIDEQHVAHASKDRTSLFDGRYFKIDQSTGKELLTWLENGVEPPKVVVPTFADHIAAIDNATTIDDLKAAYINARKFAGADEAMLEQFVAAKDQRKEQLTTTTQEAS